MCSDGYYTIGTGATACTLCRAIADQLGYLPDGCVEPACVKTFNKSCCVYDVDPDGTGLILDSPDFLALLSLTVWNEGATPLIQDEVTQMTFLQVLLGSPDQVGPALTHIGVEAC